jgi:hypothetical protein
MSKVKGEQTATEAVKKTRKTASATDARGRLIVVATLNALQYYNVVKAMGASAENRSLLDLAMIAATVCKINTQHYAVPTTERDIQFLIQELDFDGLEAVGKALAELTQGAAEEVKGQDEAAKN